VSTKVDKPAIAAEKLIKEKVARQGKFCRMNAVKRTNVCRRWMQKLPGPQKAGIK